jgi:hypothetical protein
MDYIASIGREFLPFGFLLGEEILHEEIIGCNIYRFEIGY